MKITQLVCSAGKTGFFFDDQKAIKTDAKADGNTYVGTPVTDGFTQIRQAGESISVMLVLEDGQVAYGDCAAVQYSGAGGRDPLFLAKDFIPVIEKEIKPLLVGKDITSFKEMAEKVDHLKTAEGKQLHTAIRYGVTQAILDAVAKAQHKQMAQVIADEYGLTISDKVIPIFSQSGDDRYLNTDKMILKGSDVLPHALINHVKDKLGEKGEKLEEYIKWLRDRIISLRPSQEYHPVLHIDVYGTLGLAFNNDFEKIVAYLGKLEQAAKPFSLRIEGPVDVGEREQQMLALKTIRELSEAKGIHVEIVADEWCNTYEDVQYFTDNKAGHMAQIKTPDLGGINNAIEAVIYCKQNGMGAYLGGTCNETDRSAQVCAHIAMATSPIQCLAKPGMGVDEGYMIVFNEMQRILALKNIGR
ncbi:methylaspartate ammonia-lyase [Neisseria sp. Ec49-e6-T10]|uniref:methylaspartate ammonia-lyase n=1 Tax=Neisseria sp. Ec49-e6-T10 TaxID=3140744 RepID=UPI003EBECDC3